MRKKRHSQLWLYFTGIVFATIFVVFVIVLLVWLGLFELGFIEIDPRGRHIPILLFAVGSLLLGGIIAIYVGKLIIRPIQNMSNAFDELSKGKFDVRISEDGKILEIKEMSRRFNAMAHDLSHIETLRSDFVANVSHEFKTPIAAIEGYATLLQNHNLTQEKHDRYVEKILENSRRLSSMSGNILLLSKLENQEMVPNQSEYRLDEQIRQCVLMLESKWTAKEIELDIALEKITYFGCQALLEQVWLNLLDNAIKHSPAGGLIIINAKQEDNKICVAITDRGDGMTEEVQKHIFEKFYQGDPSRKAEGNGLGLALVKRIMDLCKGNVSVCSTPNQGSTFVVELIDHK